MFDSIRGFTKTLNSNGTSADYTWTGNLNLTPNSTGFSIGPDSTEQVLNVNSATYVAWQWKAGGAAVANTSGSISSQVSVNSTAGFSIVTYTGTGANATVGHGLGVAPSMVIVKSRISAVNNWNIYNANLTSAVYKLLFTSDAEVSDATSWNSTAPTSSVFSLGTNTGTNANTETFVAYCFAPIAGYSAIGKYTGNGSADGPFVYLGFRPRFILYKNASYAGTGWAMLDSSRDTFNVLNDRLFAESSAAEDTSVSPIDFTSNGFKVRSTNDGVNKSGDTIIYMAFAEAPFKYANAR